MFGGLIIIIVISGKRKKPDILPKPERIDGNPDIMIMPEDASKQSEENTYSNVAPNQQISTALKVEDLESYINKRKLEKEPFSKEYSVRFIGDMAFT